MGFGRSWTLPGTFALDWLSGLSDMVIYERQSKACESRSVETRWSVERIEEIHFPLAGDAETESGQAQGPRRAFD
jgi:hypothetical protein